MGRRKSKFTDLVVITPACPAWKLLARANPEGWKPYLDLRAAWDARPWNEADEAAGFIWMMEQVEGGVKIKHDENTEYVARPTVVCQRYYQRALAALEYDPAIHGPPKPVKPKKRRPSSLTGALRPAKKRVVVYPPPNLTGQAAAWTYAVKSQDVIHQPPPAPGIDALVAAASLDAKAAPGVVGEHMSSGSQPNVETEAAGGSANIPLATNSALTVLAPGQRPRPLHATKAVQFETSVAPVAASVGLASTATGSQTGGGATTQPAAANRAAAPTQPAAAPKPLSGIGGNASVGYTAAQLAQLQVQRRLTANSAAQGVASAAGIAGGLTAMQDVVAAVQRLADQHAAAAAAPLQQQLAAAQATNASLQQQLTSTSARARQSEALLDAATAAAGSLQARLIAQQKDARVAAAAAAQQIKQLHEELAGLRGSSAAASGIRAAGDAASGTPLAAGGVAAAKPLPAIHSTTAVAGRTPAPITARPTPAVAPRSKPAAVTGATPAALGKTVTKTLVAGPAVGGSGSSVPAGKGQTGSTASGVRGLPLQPVLPSQHIQAPQ